MRSPLMEITEVTEPERMKAARAASDLSTGHLELSELPVAAVQLLSCVLEELAEGRSLSVIHADSDMTTNQAADYLNVSRPHLVKLLNSGALPYHNVGAHKRISFLDARKYKTAQRQRSLAALDALAAQAQDLDMGY